MTDLTTWISDHYTDYVSSLTRVEKTRTLLLSGSPDRAGSILQRSYIFAVFSIKTPLERHERAFTQWAVETADLKEACEGTVYGNQKYGWVKDTLVETDWECLAQATRRHIENERYGELLECITDKLKGVSYRKGAFMLAMAGCYEFICIDSHLAEFAGYEESDNGATLEFSSAEDYFETCQEVLDQIPNPHNLPPFLQQWSVYDWMRGEHAMHNAFYREVLPEVLWRM